MGKLAANYSSDNYNVIDIRSNSCLESTDSHLGKPVSFRESCAWVKGKYSTSYFIIDKNANITTINDFVIYWNRTDNNPFTTMKGTGTSELIELIYTDGTRIIYIDESSKPIQVSIGAAYPPEVLKEGDTILEFPDGNYDVINNDSTLVSHMNKIKDSIRYPYRPWLGFYKNPTTNVPTVAEPPKNTPIVTEPPIIVTPWIG